MSLHADVLAQAEFLANKEPRRPKQASLRRAVSTAYYALFHLLVDEGSKRLARGRDRALLRQALARTFAHGTMSGVAKRFAAGKPKEPWLRALGVDAQGRQRRPSADLRAVADAFADLQQARHEADYDMSQSFTRQDCLDLVATARDALAKWRSIRGTLEADVFLVALLMDKQART